MRVVVLTAVIGLTLSLGSACAQTTPPLSCETLAVHGRALEIRVVGKPIPCEQVRAIVDTGRCAEGKQWSCFPPWAPGPELVWFRESERFKEHWSTTIEALRYPCSTAKVTAAAWKGRDQSMPFPSQQQTLADDIVRCHLLTGKSYKSVRKLLGRPTETSRQQGMLYADWGLGSERDSFFAVDSEYLSLRFDRHRRLRSARLVQG